ncbi:MAG: TetR/AcrR family transcriptional regulator [Desulfobacterales bacterium]|nr:TetR/AcrR family transcriptional regulator [Desulfobacterales bacterium]
MKQDRKISRSEQKKNTRRKLIQATYDVIAHEGIAGVTFAKVTKKAGYSFGIINFHFESKELLLRETLNFLMSDFEISWKNIIKDADLSPVDKLLKIINISLHPPLVEYRRIIVWLAFSSELHTRDTFMEINNNHDREWEDCIENLIHQVAEESFISYGMSLKQIAISLISIITGFWMEFYFNPDRRNSENAVNICVIYLSNFFPTLKKQIN